MRFSSSMGPQELSWGLTRLTFLDNFETFIVESTFEAGEELEIPNGLAKTPKYYLVLKQDAEGQIILGATEWSTEAVYVKNTGSVTVTATIAFFGG